MTLYDRCIKIILKNEGGFQRDPGDPGNWIGGFKTGRLVGTKYGISARSFPNENIPDLTIQRAKYLYYHHFWKPMNLEGLIPDLLILHLFDWGVNSGKHVPIRCLQRMIGVKDDGKIGPITTAVVNNFELVRVIETDQPKMYSIADLFIEKRKAWYIKLAQKPQYTKYLNGWLYRVNHIRFY